MKMRIALGLVLATLTSNFTHAATLAFMNKSHNSCQVRVPYAGTYRFKPQDPRDRDRYFDIVALFADVPWIEITEFVERNDKILKILGTYRFSVQVADNERRYFIFDGMSDDGLFEYDFDAQEFVQVRPIN